MKNTKPKLIIDTDPGHDDALALLMLLLSEQFEVLAVTTVAGNASIEKVTRNTQAILDLIGSSLPVYSGMSQPLKRDLVTAVVHGESGLAGFDTSQTDFQLTVDAPQKIVCLLFSSHAAVASFPGMGQSGRRTPHCTTPATFELDEDSAGDALLYYASVDVRDDGIYTTTSRAFALVGVADSITEAEEIAEDALAVAGDEGLHVRHDIGKPDLVQRRIDHMTEIRGE
jgi:hypothetical protein